MNETPASYRDVRAEALRVLFCIGVTQSFFDEDPARVPPIVEGITQAFSDLGARFGVKVLGTIDDDELMVDGVHPRRRAVARSRGRRLQPRP